MIYRKQLYRHRPHEGEYGDCHRTALGCLLGIEPTEIPNFGEYYDDADKFNQAVADWLRDRGFAMISIPFNDELPTVLNSMENCNPGSVFLVGGRSATGFGHTVIGGHGRILWDPSTSDVGIVKPMDDGHYWVSIIVPLFHYLRKDIT